jgi:hypothetical protein
MATAVFSQHRFELCDLVLELLHESGNFVERVSVEDVTNCFQIRASQRQLALVADRCREDDSLRHLDRGPRFEPNH